MNATVGTNYNRDYLPPSFFQDASLPFLKSVQLSSSRA